MGTVSRVPDAVNFENGRLGLRHLNGQLMTEQEELAEILYPCPVQWAYESSTPAPSYRIDPLLQDGSFALMVADPESFKTWTFYSMGISISSGRPLFGQFHTTQGHVMLYQLEGTKSDHEWRTKELVGDLFSDNLPELEEKFWNERSGFCTTFTQLMDLNQKRQVRYLVDRVKDEKPALFGFDSLAAAMPGDENSPEWAGRVNAFASEIRCANASTSVLAVHHPRKLSSDSRLNDPLEMIRGHSALRQFPDHVYHLKRERNSDDFTFEVIKMRNGPRVKPFQLRFHGPTEPGGVGIEYLGTADDRTGKSGATKQVLDLLESAQSKRAARRDVVDLFEGDEDKADRAIRTLFKSKKITKEKINGRVVISLAKGGDPIAA